MLGIAMAGCSNDASTLPAEEAPSRGSPLGEEVDETEEIRKRFEKR